MKFALYTQSGEAKGEVDASDKIFAAKINEQLVHQALVRQLANARDSIAHTKTRGEVRGSTRKIYRQKGTGGARHGSRYANIFRGGGAVFGPRNVSNFKKDMPRKQRRIALFSALSARANDKKIIALDKLELDVPKTKTIADILKKLPIEKSALIVSADRNDILERSTSNLPNAKVIAVDFLNIADILKFDTIIFIQDALKKAEEHFFSTKK
jgi:large subunit ribosomal protein L4